MFKYQFDSPDDVSSYLQPATTNWHFKSLKKRNFTNKLCRLFASASQQDLDWRNSLPHPTGLSKSRNSTICLPEGVLLRAFLGFPVWLLWLWKTNFKKTWCAVKLREIAKLKHADLLRELRDTDCDWNVYPF